mgnify:CR=1 FL=1
MIKLQTSRASENIGMGAWDQVKNANGLFTQSKGEQVLILRTNINPS